MALLQSLPSKMSVSSRASTRVLPWLITVCPLILLFHLSAALPVQDLRVDHALGQASQWNALTGIQRPDDFSTEGVSSQHFMRDGALPTSNVPFSHFRSQSSRQRRYSPLKKALDSTNHPASIPHEGDDLSRSNQQPQTLSDLVSFLDADRAKGLTLEDLSNLGITEDTTNNTQAIQTGIMSKTLIDNRIFRLKKSKGTVAFQTSPQSSPLILTKSRRFVPNSNFKAHIRHSEQKLDALLSVFDKSLPQNDIIRAAPQAQSSPEWRTTVLSYLLNMKAKGHKIQPVDLTKEELLANQSIRPEDEQNVVCKVSPYRVCFHMGEDGKLRPLRKAHQPMNIVRVY
ncbi:hypothetical protein TCAL_09957 [Tigriopus californicus]|uniref:Uncharacterized protein n=1 Tax=Tigriopus californicus TaxID=6832 RepID=A0A553P4J9_TIGCA|nr:hypothetical protein TCAL_09957 [Tigriopus californicus]